MQVLHDIATVRRVVDQLRRDGKRLSLVPTMGALHAGHLSLVEQALPGCDVAMASIFVNPLQFGPQEDLARYPRDLDGDVQRLQEAGVSLVFAPAVDEMIDPQRLTYVEVEGLGDRLCGARRPGHFRGVTTIVSKLFHVLQPHVAVFGLKDAQQAILLRRMVRDLDFAVEMRFGPLVRDADGLALSSRNAYLKDAERQEALLLNRSLLAAIQSLQEGERRAKVILDTVHRVLAQGAHLEVDYVEAVEIEALRPVQQFEGRVLLALSAALGDTHLIDNVILEVTPSAVQTVDLEGRVLANSWQASGSAGAPEL